ncbi:ABC transporter permease [Desulfovibrio sp. OttesenSCG-928-C14]|nr:ABC transporter permease [Desulfovibrio sp. OttesenSCG-928-C14]
MTKTVAAIPRAMLLGVEAFVREVGAMFIFLFMGLKNVFTGKQLPKVMRHIRVIGADSVYLIALISFFTGMVLGLQGYYALATVGADGILGSLVALALIRELGPVLTAVMITARAGSAMTAEIGVMRISEQLDALEVMDINPYGFMIAPRLTAGIIVFPLLTSLFNVIGIMGGYFTGVFLLGINGGIYMHRVESAVEFSDVAGGFIKSVLFAVIVVTVCCYKGYFAHLRKDGVGPEAVSAATTSAVVLSCILILVFDYVVTTFTM